MSEVVWNKYSKEEFENVQQILAMCRLSLIKKLVKKKSAAFQMG